MRFLELHIEVDDLARSEAFYSALLPVAKITRWSDGLAVALVLPDGTALGLWRRGKEGLYGGRGGDHLHFALQIAPDEYDAMKDRLASLEVDYVEHAWGDGHRSLYFFDPDGHQGEFMTKDWLDRPDAQSGGSDRAP
jgi:catechol 2,3-dioxygenase-like lactoylglutathione lyase family enzyme